MEFRRETYISLDSRSMCSLSRTRFVIYCDHGKLLTLFDFFVRGGLLPLLTTSSVRGLFFMADRCISSPAALISSSLPALMGVSVAAAVAATDTPTVKTKPELSAVDPGGVQKKLLASKKSCAAKALGRVWGLMVAAKYGRPIPPDTSAYRPRASKAGSEWQLLGALSCVVTVERLCLRFFVRIDDVLCMCRCGWNPHAKHWPHIADTHQPQKSADICKCECKHAVIHLSHLAPSVSKDGQHFCMLHQSEYMTKFV